MIQDMKTILTRMFTVVVLMMISMATRADVKVLYGEKGTEKFEGKGGSIKIEQADSKGDKTKVTVYLTFIPDTDNGYTFDESTLEVYAVVSPRSASTRAPEISGDPLTLTKEKTDVPSAKRYSVDIDPNLALWVKSADFKIIESGAKWNLETHPNAGVWYITNNTNNMIGYWVPAANPQKSKDEDAYFSSNYSSQDGDPEMPFLTTYPTNGDLNSIWILVPAKDSNKNDENGYYYIVHAKTGKYLKYQKVDSYPGDNARRKFVHLETITTPDETEKFEITAYDLGVKIKPKNDNMYLNVAGTNQSSYNGSTGNKSPYYSGMIGGMNGVDPGSKFLLGEAKCPAPTIDYDTDNNTFTISYDEIEIPVGFDILYTIDNNPPTIGGSTTTTFTTTTTTGRSTGAIPVDGRYTVKAVIARYGFILSEVKSQPVGLPDDPTITPPADCNNMVEMSAGDATIYYTIDGSEPNNNNSTLYSGPFVLNESATIRAVSYNGNLRSANIITLNYTPPYSAKPTIIQNGKTVTISGTGSIYYTTDGSNPDTGSTPYSAPITLSDGAGEITIKAVAKDAGKGLSCVVEKVISSGYYISSVSDLTKITSHPDALFIVTNGFDASGLTASISDFTGTFDGGYFTISGLDKPLFTNLNGGTVKNVKLSGVDIDGDNVGAICDVATGTTKIYNCGVLDGSVSGTIAGGLVGLIQEGSQVRVVNCFNYGNVSASGSDSYAAGIVGKNEGTIASNMTVGDVRIALCMMYGSVSGATHISPIYGGSKHVSNAQNFTEYNFYLYSNERDTDGNIIKKINYTTGDYNDQLAIEKDDYLTRFPFYRHILNTHRELAAFFLFGAVNANSVTSISSDQVEEIGHWAVKKGDDSHKYPMVEAWEKDRKTTPTQTKNDLPNTTEDYAGKLLTTMGNSGYLSVSIKIGKSNYSTSLPITDMDMSRYDYTYGKVILPFANEFEINTDYSKICTGWKITGVSGGSAGSFANYNFADRNCTAKDIYSKSTNPFIYAQGGYYIVPTGVTGITIEANFATAYYLSDATYEIGYNSSYGGRTGLGGDVPAFQSQPLYTTLTAAADALAKTTNNPHEQAIVLVGNFHYDLATDALQNYIGKAFTLMSIDADNNQEPDYGFYSIGPERPQMPPLRFDFIPIISLGMAAKVNGSNYYPGVPIWKSRGWYEQTETTVSFMNQFELDSGNFNLDEAAAANKGKGQNPCIINGGYFVQMIRSNKSNCSRVSYYKIGGNAYIKEFYPGAHSNTNNIQTTIVPVNVTGGQVDECFMTGYRSGGKAIGSDIRFWCSGGKIGKFLGAYMDKPLENSNSNNQNPGTVNMTALVDHALIGRFFGGGTSPSATITGDIKVTIQNSKVDFYCGGPEFGDMVNGRTVETKAYNTKFGEYYGAGFGGTAITYSPKDSNPAIGAAVSFPTANYTYNSNTDGLRRLTLKAGSGLATCYKFEYLMHSFDKTKLVARFITGYANFSLATTGNVTNDLEECTVENDFYGAGCQGKVSGTVTSTLTDCNIKRSAFGGGYKAESNEVKVSPLDRPGLSVYNGETGIFSEFGTTPPVTFTWVQGNGDNPTADDAHNKLYTSKDVTLTDLGNVTGNISLTIDGGYVGGTSEGMTPATAATATTEAVPAGGNVYGGGNESRSLSDTSVTLKGNAVIYGDVFGGGNKATVTGNATVNIGQ